MSCPLKALADPPRRTILRSLRSGELREPDLGALTAMSGTGLAEHLRVLRVAGLLREERRGGRPSYRLERERLRDLALRLRSVAEA